MASLQDVRGAFVLHSALLDWLRCFCVAVYPGVLQIWYVEMGLKMYSGFYFASWLVCEPSIFWGFSKLWLMTYEINENV